MKTFLGLGGLFLLLSLMWICAGDWTAIEVQCTSSWLYVRITPTLFYNRYAGPDEVFLGDNCPVNGAWTNIFYEFFYSSYECGIVTEVIQEVLMLKTKVKYISRNDTVQSEIPLWCVISNQQHPPLMGNWSVPRCQRFKHGHCLCNRVMRESGY